MSDNLQSAAEPAARTLSAAPLSFDPAAYRPYLVEFELSATKEDELLAAIWLVVVTCLDWQHHHLPERSDLDAELNRLRDGVCGMLDSGQTSNNSANKTANIRKERAAGADS